MQMKPLLPPVTVNGVTLDPALVAAEAQNHPAPKGKPGAAWKAAARALAIRELLLQETRLRGITPVPAEIAPGQWETEDEAAIRGLLDQALQIAPVDDAALQAIYDSQPDRFRAPALFEAAHILFAAAPDDAQAMARAQDRAAGVLTELAQDPRRFADLAAGHSDCSSKTAGGLLGQLSSGDTVPEFEAALLQMEVGQITPVPVQTRYGLHVIRLDARTHGAILPFRSILPRLREAQEKAAWIRASQAFVAALAARAEITGIDLSAEMAA